jgi:hypothetical protein
MDRVMGFIHGLRQLMQQLVPLGVFRGRAVFMGL